MGCRNGSSGQQRNSPVPCTRGVCSASAHQCLAPGVYTALVHSLMPGTWGVYSSRALTRAWHPGCVQCQCSHTVAASSSPDLLRSASTRHLHRRAAAAAAAADEGRVVPPEAMRGQEASSSSPPGGSHRCEEDGTSGHIGFFVVQQRGGGRGASSPCPSPAGELVRGH